jgi:hypothetical protein
VNFFNMITNREIEFTKGWEALPPQRRHVYFFVLLFLLMMLAANLYGSSEWHLRIQAQTPQQAPAPGWKGDSLAVNP